MKRFGWKTVAFLALVVGWGLVVAAYSGGGGIWVTPSAAFKAENFTGTQGGLNSADAFIATTGIGQIGPGLEGLTPPAYRQGVGWVRQTYWGWEYRGLPFISMHRNLATARFDSAGAWFNVSATNGRFGVYGTAGRWKFGSNGADLTDSSGTMTIKNENASGTMQIGGGNGINLTMSPTTTTFPSDRNVSFLRNYYTTNSGQIATSNGTLNLQIGGAIYNIYYLSNASVIDSVAANFPDGLRLTILTDYALTLKDGKNLILNGDFVGDGTGGTDCLEVITSGGRLIQEHPGSWN